MLLKSRYEPGKNPRRAWALGSRPGHACYLRERPRVAFPHAKRRIQAILPRRQYSCGPGFGGGRTVRQLVSLIDLPPSILTAAGIDVPATFRGRPLHDLLDGKAADWPREVFLQISESQVGRAIRTQKWKYSVYAPGKDGQSDAESDRYEEQFLYDMEDDPHEKNNLVTDPSSREVRAELRERLARRMAQAGEIEPDIESTTGKLPC
jgi:hypothetical protein